MKRSAALFAVAVTITVAVAVMMSQVASDQPDGLEYVAQQEGFGNTAQDHTLADAALADYGANLEGGGSLSLAVAGLVGVLVTFALGFGLFWLVRATGPDPQEPVAG